MIGTSGREEGGGESGRVEAYIGDDRDRRGFPNNAASERSDRAFREENSSRPAARRIGARERRQKNIRGERIRRGIKRSIAQSFELSI